MELVGTKTKILSHCVKSDILEAIQASQYVHPMTNPAKGPMYSFAISTNELKRVLLNNNSPSVDECKHDHTNNHVS